jgi:chromate transporter
MRGRRRSPDADARPPLRTVAAQWGRIGTIGFGGPPAHIALLRELCVDRRQWINAQDFEDAIAACNLLPGPASTQLAIFSAWRVAGIAGAIVGGIAFIVPGLVVILALAVLFLATAPPTWVLGAGAGAGAAVAAVAVRAGTDLVRPSLGRAAARWRWLLYASLGGIAAATVGPWLVVVLLGCGITEVAIATVGRDNRLGGHLWPVMAATTTAATGGLLALVWVAFKVGALSYGGGFVIIPLMQGDAVHHYHWMTNAQFLDAVALGQVTPGPVVQTVAVVGYAAAGIAGGLLAALVAFTPSFTFVLAGAPHFDRLRHDARAGAFLNGAGPAAIGAIIGVAVPLAGALGETWQYGVLAAAAVALFALRRSVVITLVGAGLIGAIAASLLGAPLP